MNGMDIGNPQDMLGRTVVGSDGDKIGKAGQIYLDDTTGRPEWVTVHTGLFGSGESFVPLADASFQGDDIVVPYDKSTVKDAPRTASEDGHISESEEAELYRYYGLSETGTTTGTMGTTGTTGRVDSDRDEVYDDVEDRTVGRDTSGPTTDDAMTRSEERLNVGTEKVQTGKARLRKYVTTEHVQTTVPVTKEKVRLETEPITDGNVGQAMDGPAISEEEHEVTLTEERPVVSKETVPVERVRLAKDTETERRTVEDEVRKEEVDLRGAPETTTRGRNDR
ncbi:MAG: DUF2382 domain-containing protein [Motilibacteraceae bacterium]